MRRRRKPRAVRPICTYEVHYAFFAYEYTEVHYRLRCPQLTRAQLSSSRAFDGEIAVRNGNKWGEFGPGALPAIYEYMSRAIFQVIDKPAMAVVQGGK